MSTKEKTIHKKTKKNNPIGFFKRLKNDQRIRQITGLVFWLLSFLLFIAFTSYLFTFKTDHVTTNNEVVQNAVGEFGFHVSKFFIYEAFGIAAYAIIFILVIYGINLLLFKIIPYLKTFVYAALFLIWGSTMAAFSSLVLFPQSMFPLGGAVGNYIAGPSGKLIFFFKSLGTGAILLIITLTLLIWFFDISLLHMLGISNKKNPTDSNKDQTAPIAPTEEAILQKETISVPSSSPIDKKKSPTPSSIIKDDFEVIDTKEQRTKENKPIKENLTDLSLSVEKPIEEKIVQQTRNEGNYDPTLDLASYTYPPLDLLKEYGSEHINIDKEELEHNKNQIVHTLSNYNIQISKIKATVGPTVTLYEIIPAPGVRISKIKNLEDDIALSLAALGIRIIAPIPGKGTIGIEVPNKHSQIVSMRSLIRSEKFRTTKAELPVVLGKSISNEIYIGDLAKMPHLLMAGATGQGKSVGINAILVSLLYKKHPSQLKFVLVDPKKVELSIYNTIEKHFLAKLPGEEEPIITDVRKVVNTLNALCIEMDERYELLKKAKTRNIKEYNVKFIERKLNPEKGHRFLPYIVLVVDEFADLIMTAGKEIETPIARLAQLARAIGIHLVMATQRPSVNIITGTIKANFPARLSFRVTSKIDSRTILDVGGAEQLIGKGDMLFSTGSDTIRLQCGFVDTPEVELVIDYISEQQGYPDAFLLPEYEGEDNDSTKLKSNISSERDTLFEDAARVVVQNQMGSTSLIQRRLKLGYNRAGRLMDQLEDAGIVGPSQGSKAREVYMHSETELDEWLKTLQ